MKTCTKCGEEKPLGGFYKNKTRKDGLAGECSECIRSRVDAWRKTNPEQARARFRAWKKANPERVRENQKAWRQANPETHRKHKKAWHQTNLDKYREYSTARRAGLDKATPSWVDRAALAEIYKNCPPGYHVDHIVPLKGKNVCGLHVPANLQYLPAVENIRKGNRFEEEAYGQAA